MEPARASSARVFASRRLDSSQATGSEPYDDKELVICRPTDVLCGNEVMFDKGRALAWLNLWSGGTPRHCLSGATVGGEVPEGKTLRKY
jgi:hypothetical protein